MGFGFEPNPHFSRKVLGWSILLCGESQLPSDTMHCKMANHGNSSIPKIMPFSEYPVFSNALCLESDRGIVGDIKKICASQMIIAFLDARIHALYLYCCTGFRAHTILHHYESLQLVE